MASATTNGNGAGGATTVQPALVPNIPPPLKRPRGRPPSRGRKTAKAKRAKPASPQRSKGRWSTRLKPAKITRMRKLIQKGLPNSEIEKRLKVSATAIRRQRGLLESEGHSPPGTQLVSVGTPKVAEPQLPAKVLGGFRRAYDRSYAEVRAPGNAQRDFTRAEHEWMLALSDLVEYMSKPTVKDEGAKSK